MLFFLFFFVSGDYLVFHSHMTRNWTPRLSAHLVEPSRSSHMLLCREYFPLIVADSTHHLTHTPLPPLQGVHTVHDVAEVNGTLI